MKRPLPTQVARARVFLAQESVEHNAAGYYLETWMKAKDIVASVARALDQNLVDAAHSQRIGHGLAGWRRDMEKSLEDLRDVLEFLTDGEDDDGESDDNESSGKTKDKAQGPRPKKPK